MRKFIVINLLGMAALLMSGRLMAQSTGATSISASFTPASIPAGRDVWFAAAVKVTGTATYPLTIYFRHQTISCSAFSFPVPDGELILDPSYTHSTNLFNGSTWVTTSPPNETGNYFIAAGQYTSPSLVPGGLTPVTWAGIFTASHPGVSLSWQWWCASYYGFDGPIYSDGTKASDCNSCTIWGNADHAGSPEYVNTEHDLSGLNVYTGGGTGYSYTDTLLVACGTTDVPIVSVSASEASICAGDSITFTASAVNAGSAPLYQWKLNDTNIGPDSSTATYTLHAPLNGDHISLVLTSSDSLASPSTAVSNTIVVTVNSTPTPATLSGGTTLCTGGRLALSASAGGGVWSSSNTAIGTVSASGVVTAVGSGTDIISYTTTNSCGSAVATTTLTASPAFTLSGTLTNPTCSGYTNGSVVASASPGEGHTYSYAWSNGSTSYGLWGVPASTYSVTATNEAGCVETQAFTLTQPAALASTYSETDAYPYGAGNGAIYYGVSGGTWPYSYSWSNGATTQNITGLAAGSYVVTVTDANSCNLTNWFSVGQPSGWGARMASGTGNTPGTEPEAEAFPNPFSSEATISFSTPQDGQTTVEVYNAVNGVKEATLFNDNTKAGQEYSCKLSGAQLASGIYLYKIVSSDKNLYTGKIVLVK